MIGRHSVLLALALSAFLPAPLRAGSELRIGEGLAKGGTAIDVPLVLSTTDEVQGLVAAFEWDAGVASGVGIAPEAMLAEADVVVTRVEATYMILGVVIDDDGLGIEAIPPGEDRLLASARIHCAGTVGGSEIRFADRTYAAVDGAPLLENVVVVGGSSISVAEGLVLTPGRIDCAVGIDRFSIDSPTVTSQSGAARVLMENTGTVEGYVVALCHPAAELELTEIVVGQAALSQAADFQSAQVLAEGGTLAVVIDLVEPFTDNAIPPGDANHIATYRYRCRGQPPAGGRVVPLTFCDGVLGDPATENAIVIGGLSVAPLLEDGTFTCSAPHVREDCCNGVDDNGNGLVDFDDPDCFDHPGCGELATQSFLCGARTVDADGIPAPLKASTGESTEICFYIRNPEDGAVGQIAQYDHVQGFSMALSFCCDIVGGNALDTAGTILEAIGAEYINVDADNDPNDGDGCELIIGVLVDALPPFDGATIPPMPKPQRMGCVAFEVKDDPALCGSECPVAFTDGVNGTGKVPLRNLVAVENTSRPPLLRVDCPVAIVNRERFFRGDCNFSGAGLGDGTYAVDIADAATVVSYLFAPPLYKPRILCRDACDCNDDGRVDLADAVCILVYLFQGGRFPPAPGPGLRETGRPNPNAVEGTPPGPDPTLDLLDCEAGDAC